jgi:calcium/calmodulin-dependent protein kinase I
MSKFSTEDIENYYDVTNEVLGTGYFAVVKVGFSKATGEKVAIKCVDKSKVEREETLQNEIDILSKIDHDGVVRMHHIFDAEETLFIVMELMEGGELYDEIIKRSLFSEKEASLILKQIVEALAYLHAQNVVHRDLKLENLLLKEKVSPDQPLRVKIADFGLSKLYSGNSMHTACGTPFYVAPDILMAADDDDAGYGPPVDMWAVGVLLYILLSGRLPFSGDEDDELFKNILEAKIVWKSPQFDTVSEDAKDLIQKLIVVNPEDRYTAVQALTHPFVANNNHTAPLHTSLAEGLKGVQAVSKQRVKK